MRFTECYGIRVYIPHRTPPELRRLAMNLSVAAILVFHPPGSDGRNPCIYIVVSGGVDIWGDKISATG